MKIQSLTKNYELIFISNWDILAEYAGMSDAFFVVDEQVYNLYKPLLSVISKEQLFLFSACEENKNIESVLSISSVILKRDAKRNLKLIAIGGGITQDVCGFVASVLYRGISLILFPTTLLSMVDSSIGGKNGVNFEGLKNILGTINPPDRIYIWTDFVKSLDQKDYRSGLGEMAKASLLRGEKAFEKFEKSLESLLSKNIECLQLFIEESIELKRNIVEEDEFEMGKRKWLNYGHTFGHALESVSQYVIPHGQAVLYGIMMANRLSVSRSIVSESTQKRIEATLLKIVNDALPSEFLHLENFIQAMQKDKKKSSENLVAILMDEEFSFSFYKDVKREEVGVILEKMTKF